MAKVLITGANGFLGSWLVKKLLTEQHQVFCLVRKSSDLSELKGLHVEYLFGDVTDLGSLQSAFKNMDSIFHLAGLIAYKKSERNKMNLVNVEGTRNVIQASIDCKIRRLVHLSSVVAIGSGFTEKEVLTESSAFNVHHLNLGYFETKFEAEKLVIDACKNGLLDAVILNPSTIYGPGDAKKGSRKTQLKVAQGKFKFYTSGGVNVVYVADAVEGIVSAWKKGRKGERYILAGENITIKNLFAMIAKAAGQNAPEIKIPNFLLHLLGIIGDVLGMLGFRSSLSRENAWTATMFHWFDSSKAQRELDFHPQPAQIAIAESVKWIKENHLLEKNREQ